MEEHSNMPIRAKPYKHQIGAFNFVCSLFGLEKDGDANISIGLRGSAALLMEM